jgi:hypothetical protein
MGNKMKSYSTKTAQQARGKAYGAGAQKGGTGSTKATAASPTPNGTVSRKNVAKGPVAPSGKA